MHLDAGNGRMDSLTRQGNEEGLRRCEQGGDGSGRSEGASSVIRKFEEGNGLVLAITAHGVETMFAWGDIYTALVRIQDFDGGFAIPIRGVLER